MEDNISLFGYGFIGGEYATKFPWHIDIEPKYALTPKNRKILYFISTTHNYHVFDNPYLDIETNLRHLVLVLEAARKKFGSAVEFNFISSWFVYGLTPDLPAREDSVCDPRGFYAITKRAAEQLLESYCNTFNLRYRILRLCNVLGTSDHSVSLKKNALQEITRRITCGVPVEVYRGNENVIRDYAHVSDVCRAIRAVIHNCGTINSITNVGNGEPLVVKDLIDYVIKKTGGTVEYKDPPQFHKTVQAQKMWMDTTKLRSLGYSPEFTIWQTLDELIAYYEKQ